MPNSVDYHSRHSANIQRDKKRSRQLDWEETRRPAWIAWLSLLCLVVIFVGVIALSTSDRTAKPQAINGDMLGPFDSIGVQYQAQADEKLAQAQGEQPRWALVSPEQEWTAEELAELLRSFDARVSTLLLGPGIQVPIPEPAVGMTRRDVIDQAVNQIARSSQGTATPADIRFSGVIVYATPEQLRGLHQASVSVFAVEPAPVGAVLARIGIRSVDQG